MRRFLFDRSGHLRPLWGLLLFLACFLGLARLTGGYIHTHPMSQVRAMDLRVLSVLVPSVLCLLVERRPLADLGLRLDRRWGKGLLAGAGLGGGIVALSALANRALGGFHWDGGLHAAPPLLLGTAILLFTAALNEELLFRGYPFQRLVALLGFWPAQGLVALLFALAHWSNPGMDGTIRVWGSVNIACASLLLGAARRRAGDLSLPLGLHWAWNLVQGPLLGFAVSGDHRLPSLLHPVLRDRPVWISGGTFGLETTLTCAALALGACLFLARRPRARALQLAPSDLPAGI
ncbi:hypothetical protein GETHPA_12950 [Geothrix rubra]|uniref:CAAX prenyl protease 2/Lysostaphin resistance protein A-like domain-containing protein n=1 Tax=Geothrix rubra TaxID=2927977 RepID=A0ABQ5Q4Z1_9BACT|nr:CPBP family intramembrane glutamic endopeptidase [Geothrix rubra]GLH69762.1 hypothetical protein GETHPA_12950 [Geothrix rubra]